MRYTVESQDLMSSEKRKYEIVQKIEGTFW